MIQLAMIRLAMIDLMTRRLTGETSPDRRNTQPAEGRGRRPTPERNAR
ncbi:hypothetical protein [Streptomyces sp. NPDC003077]